MDKDKTPLHRIVYNDILNKIKTGTLRTGDKLPTEFELMDMYNVSRITVSHAMNDLAEDGFVVRIRKKGTFVKSAELEPASSKKPKSVIACLVNVDFGQLGNFIDGMQTAAQKHDFLINTYCSNRNVDTERTILKKLLNDDVDGIICQLVESYENMSLLLKLKLRNIPVIALDHPLNYIDVPLVCTDHCKAGYDITNYLIDKGHRRIAFATYSIASTYGEQERIRGYLKALEEHNIRVNDNYIVTLNMNTTQNMMAESDYNQLDMARSFVENLFLLPQPPTALICAHDMMAAFIEEQALKIGISIPDELSIVGFDDQYYCDFLKVPLTSMAQDFFSIGNYAVEQLSLLKSGVGKSKSIFIPSKIVERKSVKFIKNPDI